MSLVRSMRFEVLLLLLLSANNLTSISPDNATFIDVVYIFIPLFFYCVFHKFISFNGYFLYFVLYFEAMFSVLISPQAGFTSTAVTYFLYCVLVLLISSIPFTPHQLRKFEKYYNYLAIICCILIILSWMAGITNGENRYSIGIVGVKKNQNYVNDIILLSFAFLLSKMYFTNRIRLKEIALILLFFFACFLTGTRAALLTLGLLALVYIFLIFFKKGKKSIAIWIILLGSLGIFLLFNILPPEIAERFIGEGSSEDNLRTLMWANNYLEFIKSPFLGMGLGQTDVINAKTVILENDTGDILSLHNVLLQFLYEQGILGVLIFIVILRGIIKRFRKEDRLFGVLMMLALYFPISFQNGLVGFVFWWPLMLLEIYSRTSKRQGLISTY